MGFVIKCEGYATGIPCPYVGKYLQWFDPDSTGDVGGWTDDLELAKQFASINDAINEYFRERNRDPDPTRVLFREQDRPLTAFSVTFLWIGYEKRMKESVSDGQTGE